MRRGKLRNIFILLILLLFLSGLAVLLYPHLWGAIVDHKILQDAREFLTQVDILPSEEPEDLVIIDSTTPTEPEAERLYPDLWEDMTNYNKTIYAQGQSGLSCEYDYQKPSFYLTQYGLEDEVFGVISIPAMELKMPIYLGATNQHMADGAAHLSQTSLPIGGKNTNCVIAGHRGYNGAAFFRYVTELKPGDKIIITNLWETMTYEVTDTKIIMPNEVDQILIQEGRDMITLLTCHPYASGGKQRYLVFCDRVPTE